MIVLLALALSAADPAPVEHPKTYLTSIAGVVAFGFKGAQTPKSGSAARPFPACLRRSLRQLVKGRLVSLRLRAQSRHWLVGRSAETCRWR